MMKLGGNGEMTGRKKSKKEKKEGRKGESNGERERKGK